MTEQELKKLYDEIKMLPIINEKRSFSRTITKYKYKNSTIKVEKGSKIIIKYLNECDELDNSEGPAKIVFTIICDKYYLNEIGYYRNGRVSKEDGPAIILYYDEKVSMETYMINGNTIENKPTYIYYNKGVLYRKEWYKDDKLHNENGPAVVTYNEGEISSKTYYYEGKCHRTDGPAFQNWFDINEYYLYDNYYSEEQFNKVVSDIKNGILPKQITDMTKSELEKYACISKTLNNDLYEEISAAILMLKMLKDLEVQN